MADLETLPIRAQETRKYETHLVGPKHSAYRGQSEWWASVDAPPLPVQTKHHQGGTSVDPIGSIPHEHGELRNVNRSARKLIHPNASAIPGYWTGPVGLSEKYSGRALDLHF
jgi:hypothetical protein